MQLRGTVWEGVDWINLTEHEDKWQAFVNKAMKILVQ
jgi:hypothetical protein